MKVIDLKSRNPLFIKSEFSQSNDRHKNTLWRSCQVAILYSSSQNSLEFLNNF